AAALLRAARCVGETRWEREAIAIAEGAALVRGDDAGVVDVGLCHGSAGVAHIFHRMYRATGVELFRETALHWFEHTLELRHLDGSIAGYRAWRAEASGAPLRWEDCRGVLEGAAGVGLALQAAVSNG